MNDIFSDIYDRILSFFTPQTDESKVTAKSRLKTVLMQDRVGFSERAMQMLKDDLIDSISRYLEIDIESFDLSIDANENATILNLSIPVLRPKTDEEIDEALSLQEQVKIEKTEEIVGEIKELVKEKVQKLAEQMNEDIPSEEKSEQNADEMQNEADDKEDSKPASIEDDEEKQESKEKQKNNKKK